MAHESEAVTLFQVTENVHFARGSAVNWVLVTDDTGVMLIDAGYPGDRQDVLTSLRQVGYDAENVHAILLTHAHIDHLGSAIWFANEHGTPVYCHAEEVGHAKREYLEQASVLDKLKPGTRLRDAARSLTVKWSKKTAQGLFSQAISWPKTGRTVGSFHEHERLGPARCCAGE